MSDLRATEPDRDEPPVDVVVPTYGPCPYLREAVESIVAQTYRAWRLTIVDNSPESGAAAAVHQAFAADERVRYLATGGLDQAQNWNAALRSGDAPLVAMLHDDDHWDPTFLAPRVQALLDHDRCAFAFGGYRQILADGRELAIRPLRIPAGVHEPADFIPEEYVANLVSPGAVLYRRAAIDADGAGFHPTVPYPDYEYWLRLGSRWPIVALDVTDSANRLHGGSVTNALGTAQVRRAGQLWLDFLDIVEPMLDEALPGAISADLRRRRRASALLTSALDELQLGNRSTAAADLRAALRVRPAASIDVRVPSILLLLAVGPRARSGLARLRVLQQSRQLPVHLPDVKVYAREQWLTWRLRSSETRS